MDLLIAMAVLIVLVMVIVGVVRWARGGAPYDDGTAPMFVPYVPEPVAGDAAGSAGGDWTGAGDGDGGGDGGGGDGD